MGMDTKFVLALSWLPTSRGRGRRIQRQVYVQSICPARRLLCHVALAYTAHLSQFLSRQRAVAVYGHALSEGRVTCQNLARVRCVCTTLSHNRRRFSARCYKGYRMRAKSCRVNTSTTTLARSCLNKFVSLTSTIQRAPSSPSCKSV